MEEKEGRNESLLNNAIVRTLSPFPTNGVMNFLAYQRAWNYFARPRAWNYFASPRASTVLTEPVVVEQQHRSFYHITLGRSLTLGKSLMRSFGGVRGWIRVVTSMELEQRWIVESPGDSDFTVRPSRINTGIPL